MINDIKSHRNVIKNSLEWADKFGKDSFPKEVFKNYRRKLRMIQDALSENCSAAAYGESQVGKSYLMSSLLSSPSAPFVINNKDIEYSFIDDINPSGGKVSQNESTGIITRFTIRQNHESMKDYVRVKMLSIVDIILLLTDSYYNDLKINPDSVLAYTAINDAISNGIDSWTSSTESQFYIVEDDIKDINDYIKEIIGNNAINIYQSNFCKQIATKIEFINPDCWVNVFGLLWNNNPEFNKLFSTLLYEYRKLNFSTEIYLPFSAVLRKKGTILKIDWLNTVFGNNIELDEEEEMSTDIYSLNGDIIAHDFNKGILSALIGEITFTLPEAISKERKFLKKIDLLDFPGARSREKFKEEDLKENIPMVLRRGKVAYLFNKYSRNKLISSVLFCHHNNQKADATIGNSISNWIETEIGITPEERAKQLALTNGISPLFMICTKFNIDLIKTKTDCKGCNLEEHWDRFKKTIPELINQEKWFNNWVPIEGRFTSKFFQNIYLLRDFYWSSKELFTGYSDDKSNPSPETAYRIPADYPEYFNDLRNSFLDNQFVKEHFENPIQSWADVATLNNDGSKAIIKNLDAIAEVLDQARRQRYYKMLIDIRDEMIGRLKVYYESNNKDENNRKVRKIIGDIKLITDFNIGNNPEKFGYLIDNLMISSSKLRSIVYNVIVCHTDEPSIVTAIKMIRAMCGIDVKDDREININKLINTYSKTIPELKEMFAGMKISIEDIISDESELLATVPDVITKHIIAHWTNHINNQVKLMSDILPHADEIAFMLVTLLYKLGVKNHISNKVNEYYSSFSAEIVPNAIADYSSLTLNNFVSTVGREYMTQDELNAVVDKAKLCNTEINLLPEASNSSVKSQSLSDVLSVLDELNVVVNKGFIDINKLRKLPFWDSYLRWQNSIAIGLLYASDISHIDPIANSSIKEIIDNSSTLYN